MRTKDLIYTVTRRTGLPNDEVRLVLDTVRDIICDQLGVNEDAILPGMMRIASEYNHKRDSWQLKISPFKALRASIGADLIMPQDRLAKYDE